MSKFKSPESPPESLQRELLTLLIEECAEVQQRASKSLRFGVAEVQSGQPLNNTERMCEEVGDLLEVIRRCRDVGLICDKSIEVGKCHKAMQLDKYLQFDK